MPRPSAPYWSRRELLAGPLPRRDRLGPAGLGARVDSRALYYSGGRSGRGGNWVDETALRGIRVDCPDEKHHLAKVRVAGSNPVFRSILAGQSRFSTLMGADRHPLRTSHRGLKLCKPGSCLTQEPVDSKCVISGIPQEQGGNPTRVFGAPTEGSVADADRIGLFSGVPCRTSSAKIRSPAENPRCSDVLVTLSPEEFDCPAASGDDEGKTAPVD